MQHATADHITNGASRVSGSTAGAIAGILERAMRAAPLPAGSRLFLTVENAREHALPAIPGWAVYRVPVPAAVLPDRPAGGAGAAARLPFADGAFDTICVYGAVLQFVQQPGLLNKVRQMLRPGGTVVVAEPLASFSFTTFPIGGPAHLLRRQLLQAGFHAVRPVPEDEGLLVLTAARPAAGAGLRPSAAAAPQ